MWSRLCWFTSWSRPLSHLSQDGPFCTAHTAISSMSISTLHVWKSVVYYLTWIVLVSSVFAGRCINLCDLHDFPIREAVVEMCWRIHWFWLIRHSTHSLSIVLNLPQQTFNPLTIRYPLSWVCLNGWSLWNSMAGIVDRCLWGVWKRSWGCSTWGVGTLGGLPFAKVALHTLGETTGQALKKAAQSASKADIGWFAAVFAADGDNVLETDWCRTGLGKGSPTRV